VGERELLCRGQLLGREPAQLDEVVRRTSVAVGARRPRQAEHDAPVIGLEPVAEKLERVELEARLLTHFAPETVERRLALVQETARKIPQTLARIEGAPPEQHAPPRIETHGFDSGNGVRVPDEATRWALHATRVLVDSLAADGTEAPPVQSTHAGNHMSPRAAGATQHELSRIGLLATLAGETLAKLAQNMTREEIPAGAGVVFEGDEGDRFYVVLSGMLSVSQESRGAQAVLRPGDYFGEVALAMHMPRTASVRALTPATVASCDQATFDEYLRPLFADDG
jgi:cyclic nucleotide-binding protein